MLHRREFKPARGKRRNIYVTTEDADVWLAAERFAQKERASLSAVVAEALRNYMFEYGQL